MPDQIRWSDCLNRKCMMSQFEKPFFSESVTKGSSWDAGTYKKAINLFFLSMHWYVGHLSIGRCKCYSAKCKNKWWGVQRIRNWEKICAHNWGGVFLSKVGGGGCQREKGGGLSAASSCTPWPQSFPAPGPQTSCPRQAEHLPPIWCIPSF